MQALVLMKQLPHIAEDGTSVLRVQNNGQASVHMCASSALISSPPLMSNPPLSSWYWRKSVERTPVGPTPLEICVNGPKSAKHSAVLQEIVHDTIIE